MKTIGWAILRCVELSVYDDIEQDSFAICSKVEKYTEGVVPQTCVL